MKFTGYTLLRTCLLAVLPCLSYAEVLLQNPGEPIPTDIIRSNSTPAPIIPFTTFTKEHQNILNNLPCKWVSQNGKVRTSNGTLRYSFLCKGGTWGTISLYLNQASGTENAINKVSLHYRAWNPEAHPSAGEAAEAQKFLQHVVTRFVPSNLAEWTLESFWGESPRRWEGQGVLITFENEATPTFNLHKLEITGSARQFAEIPPQKPAPQHLPSAQKTASPAVSHAAAATGLTVVSSTAPSPTTPPVRVIYAVTPTLPVSTTPTIQWKTPATPSPTLPKPQATDTPLLQPLAPTARPVSGLLVPAQVPSSTVDMLKAWTTPKKDPTPTLVSATAAELNTRPAPESQSPTIPPPAIDSKLVPNNTDTINSRPKAPSNFDAYNRAEQLTRSVEERARITGTAAKPSTAQQTLSKPDQPAPSLPAVPTPSTQTNAANNAVTIEPKPTFRQPSPRPLPQLKFIPAAEPLPNQPQIIQFEDEKSGL